MRLSMAPTESEPQRPSHQVLLDAYARARDVYEAAPTPEHHLTLEFRATQLLYELHRPGRFALGQLVMTPGVDVTLQRARQLPLEFLLRHKFGDWGNLPPEDLQENEHALREGSRLFSSYLTRTEEKLWIITEWDRSATTLLLPEEY